MREHVGVFASLLAVAAIVTGLALGVLGLSDRAASDGVRSAMSAQAGAEGALQFTMRPSNDPEATDEAVRATVAREFRAGEREVPLVVHHTVRSAAPVALLDPDADADADAVPPSAALASIPGLDRDARLVDGRWPLDPHGATLQADAAAELGLGVGDRVRVGERVLEITGTWRLRDGLDPMWAGDRLLIAGRDARSASTLGPLVVDDEVWEALDPALRRDVWTLVPRASELAPRDLGAILTAWAGLDAALADDGVGDVLDHAGRLALVTRDLDRSVRALDAIAPAALLLVAMIALVTFVELGRLLAQVRARELALLWARGATPRSVARTTSAETGIAVLAGILLGVGAAAAFVANDDPEGIGRLGTAWYLVPLLVLVAAVGLVAGQALLATRRASRIDDPGRSGRAGRVASGGVVVLVALAATLATWQLRLYASPVTPNAAGGASVDPIAVAAPALVVAAVLLASLVLLPRLTPLAERWAAHDRRAPRVLAARTVSRRLALFATPVALVALAASQLFVAVGYADTWERSHAQMHALRSGSELRVEAGAIALGDEALDDLVGTSGVERVAPVSRDVEQLGDDDLQVLAVAPDALGDLGLDGDGTVDPRGMAELIRTPAAGAVLPVDAGRLTVQLTAARGAQLPDVVVWVQSDDGLLRRSAATADATGGGAFTAAVPALPAGQSWRLIGIDLALPLSPDDDAVAITLDTATADGTALDLGTGWRGLDLIGHSLLDPAGANGASATPGTRLRLTPPTRAGALPVVISGALADTIGVEVGGAFGLPFAGGSLPVVVAAVVPGIPGSDRSAAMLVDSRRLGLELLRSAEEDAEPRTLWVGSDDPAQLVPRLQDTLAGRGRVMLASADPEGRMLATGTVVLAVTALGSAALALVALGAVVGAQLRSRRGETAVLRALGFSAGEQARLRRRELAAIVAYGLVVGLVAGALVVIVVITVFARAAIPDAYSAILTDVTIDPALLAAVIAAWAVAVALLVTVYGGLVRRQARGARIPEDAR